MENTYNPDINAMQDVSSHDEYRICIEAGLDPSEAIEIVNRYSRDNTRTPFQWNDGLHAGFTTGTPWLPENPNYKQINAAAEVADPESVYHFYRKAIALRKDPSHKETFVYGVFEPIATEDENVIAYARVGEERLDVYCNFQNATVTVPCNGTTVLLSNYEGASVEAGTITLHPFEAVVLKES